jgi:hypothetical protein
MVWYRLCYFEMEISANSAQKISYERGKWPRQESNLYLELRKLLYYPLYYEALMPLPDQAANI